MAVTTVTTQLTRSGPAGTFGNVYSVTRSDGGAFTDSTGGLTSGKLVLSVANGDSLDGFPVPASLGGGPGFTPDGTQVRVRGYCGTNGPVGSVVLDASSFLRDAGNDNGTSIKCNLFMTSAVFTEIVIECPC